MATAVIKGSRLSSTQSLQGNGVDKYAMLDSAAFQAQTQGSVSLWFKLTSLPVSDALPVVFYSATDTFASATAPVMVFAAQRTAGITRLRIVRRPTNGGTTSVREGATALAANVWYHVVFVGNNTNSRIYLNGVEEPYIQTSLAGGWWGNMVYGAVRRHAMYARWLNGTYGLHVPARIASLGIWGSALSASEVTELYRGGRAANLTRLSFANVLNLLAWYRPGTEMNLPTLRDWYQGQNMTTTNFVTADIVTDHPPL